MSNKESSAEDSVTVMSFQKGKNVKIMIQPLGQGGKEEGRKSMCIPSMRAYAKTLKCLGNSSYSVFSIFVYLLGRGY